MEPTLILMHYAGFMIDTQKLQVLEVESWSPAYKQGTRTGCMVTHVNQHPVNDWDDYTRLAKNENEFDLILKFKSADQHRHAVVRFHAILGKQCVYAGGASNFRVFTRSSSRMCT